MSSGITITADTGTEFSAGAAEYNSIHRLDDTHFIVAYRDDTDADQGKVIVGSRSGTTITINEADAVTFNADVTINITVRALTSTLFVISYTELNSQRYYVRAGTISGTTITLGTAVQLVNSNMFEWCSVAQLDSTNFVVTMGDESSGNDLRAFVGSISGTTITLGTAQTTMSEHVSNCQTVYLDSTHFAVAYRDNGVLQYNVASVNTGAKTVTWGTATSNSANIKTTNLFISAFSSQNVLIGYTKTSGGGTELFVTSNTINLSTLTFTVQGSELATGANLSDKSNYSLITISSLNFIVSYYTTTGTEGEVRSGTLSSGTSLAWDAQGAVIFDNAISAHTGLCALTDSVFILGYKSG